MDVFKIFTNKLFLGIIGVLFLVTVGITIKFYIDQRAENSAVEQAAQIILDQKKADEHVLGGRLSKTGKVKDMETF